MMMGGIVSMINVVEVSLKFPTLSMAFIVNMCVPSLPYVVYDVDVLTWIHEFSSNRTS